MIAAQLTLHISREVQVEEAADDRDAETRVAAVKALALVAHKLYSIRQETANHDEGQAADLAAAPAADPAAAMLVHEHVVNALLVAVEDYSTDNRSGPFCSPLTIGAAHALEAQRSLHT